MNKKAEVFEIRFSPEQSRDLMAAADEVVAFVAIAQKHMGKDGRLAILSIARLITGMLLIINNQIRKDKEVTSETLCNLLGSLLEEAELRLIKEFQTETVN